MSIIRKLILLLIAGCLVAGCAGEAERITLPATPTQRPPLPTPTPPSYPAFVPGSCPTFVSTQIPHECGHLLVLEDRSQMAGRVVRLPVVIFRTSHPEPAPDPVIYLPAGEGQSQLHNYQRVLDTLGAAVLQDRDLIFYNQRGSELTFPHFFCDRYSEFLWEISSKSWSRVEHNLAVSVFWRTCFERLKDRDLDLSRYDSAANAADADDLRRALGYEQANFVASSNGTRSGLALIRDHAAGVRSLILESARPLEADAYAERAGNATRALEALFAACESDDDCAARFPDLRTKLLSAVDELDRRPITVRFWRGPLSIDGASFLYAILSELASSETIPRLPQRIYEAADGDLTALEPTILSNLNAAHHNPALAYTAQCREELPFTDFAAVASPPEWVPAQVASVVGQSRADLLHDLCQVLDVDPAGPGENEAVRSRVPTLVLAGQFDPVSPPEWGQRVATSLENAYLYQVAGAGQDVLASGPCVQSLARSFLHDPTQEPDASCLDSLAPVDYWPHLPVPRFEPSGCYFQYAPGSHRVQCGYLVVPEDRDLPDGPAVKLHVAIFKSSATHPAPDPVIYVSGGGGGNHLDAYETYLEKGGNRILRTRDYVMYNQRGTRYNHPALECPGYADLMRRHAQQGLSREEQETQIVEFFADCYARLEAEGINVVPYDSDDNAADINDLRLALGYDQINLYGTSYGTRVILGVLRDYPEAVRSAILDSVYPPQVSLYVALPHAAQRAFETVFDDCTADPGCAARYPDLRDTFYRLVNELNADPLYVGTIWVDGNMFLDAIYFALYHEYAIPQIPKWIEQASHGDHRGLVWFYEVGMVNDNADRAVAHGVHYSLLCREEAPFNDPADALARADELHPAIQEWMGWPPADLSICDAWDVGIADPIENQPVTSNVPTLVFAGRFDPITPPAWGRLAAETLSQSHFYEFPNIGHGVMRANRCALEMGLSFLADPTEAPDSTCLTEEMPPDFK